MLGLQYNNTVQPKILFVVLIFQRTVSGGLLKIDSPTSIKWTPIKCKLCHVPIRPNQASIMPNGKSFQNLSSQWFLKQMERSWEIYSVTNAVGRWDKRQSSYYQCYCLLSTCQLRCHKLIKLSNTIFHPFHPLPITLQYAKNNA